MTTTRIPRSERPSYPDVRERVGEDPARFLATSLDATPRIRGIQSDAVLDEWEAVERDLPDGPRRAILQQLEARRQHLQGEPAPMSEDAQALISDINAMDDPDHVQAALDDEVAREDARTDVVAACNIRLDDLAEDDEPVEENEPVAVEVPDVDYDSRDDPEYEDAYRDAAAIAKAFGLQQVGERLEQERAREAPRPHVVDALEARQDVLREELPDDGQAEEVAA